MKEKTIIKYLNRVLSMSSIALFLTLSGCTNRQPEFVKEYDVVYTNYQPDFNFSSNYTYSY